MWKEAKKFLIKDRYIGPLIEKYGDCDIKPKRHEDYFDHLCLSIINQQLSGKAADTIYGRFKEKVGKVTADKVLAISDQELRDCGLSWGKVSYVKNLALKTKNGDLKTRRLSKLSDDEVEKELVAVKGIGRWTAHMFLMFTLGRCDIFPSDDLGIKNGMKKILGKELNKKEMEEFARRWKPYRTIASWYIWRSLDNR